MKTIFQLKPYNRYNSKWIFKTSNVRTVYHGTESLSFLGPKIWSILPDNLKSLKSLEDIKREVRKWKPKDCPCRLCKIYIQGVGFIN